MAESCKVRRFPKPKKRQWHLRTMDLKDVDIGMIPGQFRCFFFIWCFCWDQRVGTFGTSSFNLEHINSVSPTGSVVSSVLVCNDPIVGERVGRSLPWSQLCTTLSDTCEVQTAKREPGGKIWWTEDMTGCSNFAEFFRVDDMMMFLLRA